MTLASAIALLNPNLWLKLDEGSGTTANNSGSLANHGTLTGSYDLSAIGPEIGTTCLRMFSGGLLTTLGMDVTSIAPLSLGCWISMDASGTVGATYPVFGIGDPANPLTRGPIVWENHAALGAPRLNYRWNAGAQGQANLPTPALDWHWIVVTNATGTNGTKLYVDGQLVQQITPTTSVPALSTDPLWLRCDEPLVIAHLCFWGGRLLSQTEIQSVANEKGPWPPDGPINTKTDGGGGGGGGLTSDQAAQLTDIQTKVADIPGITDAVNFISDTVNHIKGVTDDTNVKVAQLQVDVGNIINSLFPQLADVLNDIGAQVTQILDGITSTITNLAGTVTTTIGKFFDQHSKDVLGQFNPTGGPTCEQIDWNIGGASYFGVTLTITTRPQRFWPVTPDKQWTYPDLAVIRIYISGELVLREPVHLNSHSIRPLPGMFPAQVAGIGVPIAPSDYHIIVDFADGVCGYIELDYLPT